MGKMFYEIAENFSYSQGYSGVIFKGIIGNTRYYRVFSSENRVGHIGKPIIISVTIDKNVYFVKDKEERESIANLLFI